MQEQAVALSERVIAQLETKIVEFGQADWFFPSSLSLAHARALFFSLCISLAQDQRLLQWRDGTSGATCWCLAMPVCLCFLRLV